MAFSLPLDHLIAHIRKHEDLEASRAKPGRLRRQAYSASYAAEHLMTTVRRLTRGLLMSPQLAANMFGPGPSRATGTGVFLVCSPRLRDVGGCPTSAVVETCLGDSFVQCYMLNVLERGCEPELAFAAAVLRGVVIGWAGRLKQRQDWAPALSDIASSLICLCTRVYSHGNLEALSRVQDAAGGPARRVSAALRKPPWAARVSRARCNSLPAAVMPHVSQQAGLAETVRSRPEAGEGAAEAPPAPRKRRRRGCAPQFHVSDSLEAVPLTCPDKVERRAALLYAAARLERPRAWFDGVRSESLRLEFDAGRAAAEACRGMNLRAAELGPALDRVTGFVLAACKGARVTRHVSQQDADLMQTAADSHALVLAAVDFGLALVDAMDLPRSRAAASPAHFAYVRQMSGLQQVGAMLREPSAFRRPLSFRVRAAWAASDGSAARRGGARAKSRAGSEASDIAREAQGQEI